MSETETNSKRVLSPKERRQRNREEMVAAILEAARAVMREEGVAALNLHEVARRVGLRTPSLYEYFPGKMALYDALYRFGIRRYAAGREQVRDLFIAKMHGLTALHMANEPEQPMGKGRFGSLLHAALTLFQMAWSPSARTKQG